MNEPLPGSFLRAFGLAVLAGLGAFPTALLLIGAVLLGRRLDEAMGTSPLFLITALCIVVPLNLAIMLLLARAAIRAAPRQAPLSHTDPPGGFEEENR